MIDETDLKILSILRDDARVPAAEVARQIGMAASAVFERIRKLEDRGIVRGYASLIDPHAAGYGLLAFIAVSAREGPGCAAVGRALAQVPGVQEVHHIAGSEDYLVKIRAADTEALGRLLQERFKAIQGIRSTRTTVVLNTIKETPAVELPGEREDWPAATVRPARARPQEVEPCPPEPANGDGRLRAVRLRSVKGRSSSV